MSRGTDRYAGLDRSIRAIDGEWVITKNASQSELVCVNCC